MSIFSKNWQALLAKAVSALVALALFVVMLDPLNLNSGAKDFDSYREIRNYLFSVDNANAAFFSSDNDFFEFMANENSQREFSTEFVTMHYDDMKSASSYGNWYFNKYLLEKSITHLVVPLSSSRTSEIKHKWGKTGSINIALTKPFFKKVLITGGKFPLALYEVAQSKKLNFSIPTYEVVWDKSVRKSFYEPTVEYSEVGQYAYSITTSYLNGQNMSWVYGNGRGQSEAVSFRIASRHGNSVRFKAEIVLEAAYGSYAPTQVVLIKTQNSIISRTLYANQSQKVSLVLNSDEVVEIASALPCRSALDFDPFAGESKQFCFGVSRVQVSPVL